MAACALWQTRKGSFQGTDGARLFDWSLRDGDWSVSKDVFRLVMQNHIEQGAVHAQSAVVLDKAELSEFIEKETDARTRGADHFGQRFLTDFGNGGLRLLVFAEMRQE
jgi:hypothetical protein